VLESKLRDKRTGYHKYFGVVYQLEKVRVLEMHLRLLEIAVRVLNQLLKGVTLKEATVAPPAEEQEYWLLRPYFNCLPDS